MPAISCVMPCYNREEYVAEAIESVLNQTFRDFEFIIIDDGSTDNTPEIIEEYAKNDNRIIFLQNEENKGISYSRNRANTVAKGKYIAVMDSDDISEPERFEKEIEYLENHEDIGIVGTQYFYFLGDDKNNGFFTHFETEDRQKRLKILYASPIAHATILMRKSIIDKYNIRYDSSYDGVEDYELWTRMIKITKFHSLSESLYRVRGHNNNISKESPRKTATIFKIYNNILKDIVAEDFHIPVYENPENTSSLALRESFRVLAEIPLMRLKEDFPFTRAELGMAMYKQRETIFNKLAIK